MRSVPAIDRPIEFVQSVLRRHVREGQIAVDATMGNGHDTLLLAKLVGPTGRVFAFDIQPAALASTRSLLADAGVAEQVTLFLAGHETMTERLPSRLRGKIRVVTFNLGYLPGTDKTVVTRHDSTIVGLVQAVDLLGDEGLVSVMAYPGHDGGAAEANAVVEWGRSLDTMRYNVMRFDCLNRPDAAFALLVTALSTGITNCSGS